MKKVYLSQVMCKNRDCYQFVTKGFKEAHPDLIVLEFFEDVKSESSEGKRMDLDKQIKEFDKIKPNSVPSTKLEVFSEESEVKEWITKTYKR